MMPVKNNAGWTVSWDTGFQKKMLATSHFLNVPNSPSKRRGFAEEIRSLRLWPRPFALETPNSAAAITRRWRRNTRASKDYSQLSEKNTETLFRRPLMQTLPPRNQRTTRPRRTHMTNLAASWPMLSSCVDSSSFFEELKASRSGKWLIQSLKTVWK